MQKQSISRITLIIISTAVLLFTSCSENGEIQQDQAQVGSKKKISLQKGVEILVFSNWLPASGAKGRPALDAKYGDEKFLAKFSEIEPPISWEEISKFAEKRILSSLEKSEFSKNEADSYQIKFGFWFAMGSVARFLPATGAGQHASSAARGTMRLPLLVTSIEVTPNGKEPLISTIFENWHLNANVDQSGINQLINMAVGCMIKELAKVGSIETRKAISYLLTEQDIPKESYLYVSLGQPYKHPMYQDGNIWELIGDLGTEALDILKAGIESE
ncbi:MAG: hypothetical protein ACE5I1_10580 [bacterium]